MSARPAETHLWAVEGATLFISSAICRIGVAHEAIFPRLLDVLLALDFGLGRSITLLPAGSALGLVAPTRPPRAPDPQGLPRPADYWFPIARRHWPCSLVQRWRARWQADGSSRKSENAISCPGSRAVESGMLLSNCARRACVAKNLSFTAREPARAIEGRDRDDGADRRGEGRRRA